MAEAKKKTAKAVKKPEVVETPVTPEKDVITEQQAEVVEEKQTTEKVAKAGKRSAKSLAEAEEKQAKEERKETKADADEAPKPKLLPKTRSKAERKGKNYRKVATEVDKTKVYALPEALALAVKTNPVKFDATVEVHINLGVDPRHADQNLRDTIVLPGGTGKTVRVAVFADVDDVAAAKKAGADIAAGEEFLQQLEKGTIDFDILIATPAMMAKLGKFARVLGPKGLMPNPKSGTVTSDVTKAVTEAKAGRLEYRVDSTGIVHAGVGKVSFGADKLEKNVRALFASIKSNKPASIKGTYVKAVYVTTSMGPSIRVENSEI